MSVEHLLHEDDQPPEPRSARRRRGLRALLYVLIAVVILVLLAAAGIVLLTNQLGDQVGRYPSVFAGIDPSSRPAAKAGQTFLLVGTDSRSPDPTTGADASAPDFVFGAQRSDVIMVATIADDGKSASVISIPRDSWVDVPGHGMNKVNAAFSFGGPPLDDPDDRAAHPGAHRPLRGHRLRGLPADDRRGGRHRRQRRADDRRSAASRSPRARSTSTAPRPSPTSASARSSPAATSTGSGASRTPCARSSAQPCPRARSPARPAPTTS